MAYEIILLCGCLFACLCVYVSQFFLFLCGSYRMKGNQVISSSQSLFPSFYQACKSIKSPCQKRTSVVSNEITSEVRIFTKNICLNNGRPAYTSRGRNKPHMAQSMKMMISVALLSSLSESICEDYLRCHDVHRRFGRVILLPSS